MSELTIPERVQVIKDALERANAHSIVTILDGVTPEELAEAMPGARTRTYVTPDYAIDAAELRHGTSAIEAQRHRKPTPEELAALEADGETTPAKPHLFTNEGGACIEIAVAEGVGDGPQ